ARHQPERRSETAHRDRPRARQGRADLPPRRRALGGRRPDRSTDPPEPPIGARGEDDRDRLAPPCRGGGSHPGPSPPPPRPTHADLIRREGKYWELVRRQQLQEEVETT